MFYGLYYFWSILQSRQIAFALYTFLYVAAVALYGKAKAAKPAKETIFWLFAMFLMCTFIPMQNTDIPWLLLQTMLAMYFSYSFGNGFFKGETSNYFVGDCLNIGYMFFSRFFGIFKISAHKQSPSAHPHFWTPRTPLKIPRTAGKGIFAPELRCRKPEYESTKYSFLFVPCSSQRPPPDRYIFEYALGVLRCFV